uniref:Uncharacterized protein n=1 Tax=Solanum tuberosum TaxID=4113 RepID=M1DHE9_SOLTU
MENPYIKCGYSLKWCCYNAQKHGFPDDLLFQYFYESLDVVNKGLVDHLVRGDKVKKPFAEASRFVDDMTKINQAYSTSKDNLSLPHLGMFEEQEEKTQKCDKSIDKLSAQLEMLSKYVIGGGENSMNGMSQKMYDDGA